MEPTFFDSAAAFGRWLKANHGKAAEIVVGYWKVGTDKPSLTWSASVDEALCWGWIDGVRRSLGEDAYSIRFTPRKAGSTWSKVNVAKAAALQAAGKMAPPGLAAIEARTHNRTGTYAFEQAAAELTSAQTKAIQADKAAWADWQKRAPSYRKGAAHWVNGAKQEATRAARLATLVECCAAGTFIPPFKWSMSNKDRPKAKGAATKTTTPLQRGAASARPR
ncbi:MAG: YdeI/OmpD-associated family protein [Candidatus Thermoplasmatota archaeon]